MATSCCEGETKSKRIGILNIHRQQFKIEEIELKSVRPMLFRTITLENEIPELIAIQVWSLNLFSSWLFTIFSMVSCAPDSVFVSRSARSNAKGKGEDP